MTGPIRTLLYAPQATVDVLPAAMMNMKITVANEPDLRDVFEQELILMHDGSVEGDDEDAGGPRHTEITVNVPLYFDTLPWWLVSALGLPTSTANSAPDAVVYDHVFKRSTAAEPPLSAFQFYDNVRWRQALNMVCTSLRFTEDNGRAPMLQLTYMGPVASDISAPSVPAAVSAYSVAAWKDFRHDVGGSLSKLMRFTLDMNQNRNPRYSGNETASVDRYTRGLQQATLDSVHDYLAYSGSIKETFDNQSNITNWQAKWTRTTVNIGTTPLHPTITILAPKVRIGTFDLPTENAEKQQHYTASAGKDSGIASRLQITVRNLVTAYAPS